MPTATRRQWMDAWQGDLEPSEAARRSAARLEARVSASRYYGREATARLPKPVVEAPEADHQPQVKLARRVRPRWGLLVVALMCAGLLLAAAVICPVLVNSAATDLEASLGRMEAKQRDLTAEADTLTAQIAGLSSPDRVATEANKLGLQPASSVHYVMVDGGASVGEGDDTLAGR